MNEESFGAEFDGEHIFEPLFAYKNVFKDLHHENSTKYFDNLVEKSKINIEENRVTNKEIQKLDKTRSELVKQIKKFSGLRGFLIFLIVASLGSIGYGIYNLIEGTGGLLSTLLIALGAVVLIVMLVLIFAKLNPKLKILKSEKTVLDGKINKLIQEAYAQMRPLNSLFQRGMSIEIFRKTTPIINMDRMFDSKRLDYLTSKFGLNEAHDMKRSTLFVQSGDISGNPFFLARDLIHWMGTMTYTGSIVIHWTTTTYVNGKSSTQYHTQTLTARVEKPYPYYNEQPYLVYGNEAAPDLMFSRTEKDTENMTEKQIDRQVNKQIKKIEKKSEKSISKGGEFTVMGNSEFEVLFDALNRTDEVQFRLLFTPLAQKQLLQLMKEKEIGYGDDFDFVKHKMINILYPKHLQGFNFDIAPNYYVGYDYDVVRKNFIDYNDNYFKNIFFAFAPLLSIPLYQQQEPHEYIYKDMYNSYVSFYEHEHVANMLNATEFAHPLSVTRNILKTSVVKSGENRDTVSVTAYGYRSEDRVTIVSVFGGDGRYHNVPVNWKEYLPVQNTTTMDVAVVGEPTEPTYADKVKSVIENLRSNGIANPKDAVALGAFVAYVLKK